MSSTRSRRPRSLSKSPPARVGRSSPRHPAIGGTEELTELRRVVQQQRQELEENSTALSQALARIAHSERTVSQSKSKLLATQEQLSASDAQTASLWARLQDQDAKLQHAHADRERAVAEAREQYAAESEESAAEIASLRDALAAALERERTFRRLEAELRTELDAARQTAERAEAERHELRSMAESLTRDAVAGSGECARLAENARASEAREARALLETVALRQALDSVSTLAHQLLRATEEARCAVSEAGDSERVTLKPQASPREARSMRRQTGPEILVDGLPLVP